MWVDEDGAMHTVWVPPEVVLGEQSVAALQALPADVAKNAMDDLYTHYERIAEIAMRDAPAGPIDLDEVDFDEMPYPPEFAGPVPRPDEALASTVLRFLEGVPSQWRMEALEAVCDALDPTEIEES